MKRKSLKRLFLAVTTILTMAATGIAASGAETKSFNLQVNAKESGHAFEAYQVFGGDYSEENGKGVLSTIVWGSGVKNNEDALVAALQSDATLGAYFTDKTTAAQIAEVLQDTNKFDNDSDNLDKFAAVVEKHLVEGSGTPLAEGNKTGDVYPYKAELEPGYYLIKDGETIPAGGSRTKFMLELISDTAVEAKLDTPTIEKEVGAGGQGNAAAIGDTVPFKLTSHVPTMDGYNRYFFVVHDTLSKGLKFTGEDEVKITIGGAALIALDDYEVTVDETPDGETKLKIVFKNFLEKNKDRVNEEIVITYSAKVTEDAFVGNEGNKNSASLVFSNDPSYEYDGDEPGDEPDIPTGETTDTTTYTYTTRLKVAKVDDKGMPLSGAKFKLTGEGIYANVTTKTQKTTSYVRNDQGEFVEVDGIMVPYDAAQHAGQVRYEKVEVKDTFVSVENTTGTAEGITAEVDEHGYLVFAGLGAGTYTLEETEAPEGYNKLDKAITIKVDCELPTDYNVPDPECTWKVSTADGDMASVDADGAVNIKVENKKGSMLPSTGGMGTTIFTVSGLILMLGAVVALIIKNRKGRS